MTSKRSSGIQVCIFSTFVPFLAVLTVLISFAAPVQQAHTGQASAKPSAAFASTQSGALAQAVLASPRTVGSAERVAETRLQTKRHDAGVMTSANSLSFLPAVTYDPGGQSLSVAIADLNGDGKPDLVVTNAGFAEGVIGVLLGKGDGTFLPVVTYNTGGDLAYSVAVADVNGDGKPDLLVADCGLIGINVCNHSNGLVGVLLGNGDGTFQPVVTYDSGGSTTVSIAVADVNADGKPDVVVANECGNTSTCADGSVGVLLGNGDGTFQKATTYDTKYAIDSVAGADVNGDGKLDLLVASGGNSRVGVLLGNGDGTFQPVVIYESGGIGSHSVAVADVNGDGKPDLVVANICDTSANCAHGSVSVLMGNGDGTFQTAVSYDPGGTGAWSVAVADVNGDGKPDLVVAIFFYNTVGVLLGNGDGTFQAATTYGSGGNYPSSVAVADLNGDGLLDVAVANFCGGSGLNCLPGKLGVLLNNTVELQSTTTTLTTSQNHSFYGQPITFTATVTTSGSIAPTGTVNFRSGSYGIGTGTLNASGVATFTTSLLKPGLYRITALYNGDASNLHSISAVLYQAVKQK
ncbi:MAG: hypothetical protein DMG77_03100 [Acidobacteria bacterium]|nr:MAG: hypothetical protein DMG77_03100 [Acidobacteriota bacterium]